MWDNGETNASAFSLNVGIHNVIITDANGCTTTSDINITEPIILTSSITSINDVSCNGGSDGTVMANVSGGTAPYTYSWDNGQTTDSVYNLSAGDYNVTITDYNGCSSTITATIYEPVTLNSSITGSNNVSCNGGSNGSAVVSASGGTAPYSYLWDNGQSNSYISSLSAGDYNVTVTDVNGCNTNSIITILEPVVLSSSVISLSDVSCNGGSNGSAVISANGGIIPYTYQWDNGQVGDSLSNLSAGNYNVVITDSNGCISANTITVSEPSLLVSSVSNISNVSCNGFSDGFATVSVSGGTAPYSYSWDNGQTSNTAIGLMAGNYNISITDLNGCSSTSTATITEPIILTSSITSTNDVSCNGGSDGSAVVSASGGTAPYTYLWTNGDTNETSIGLSIGTQNVIITDINGCSSISSAIINEPVPLLSSIIDSNDVSCNGGSDGSAIVSASGGTAPYTYLWSNGQTGDSTTGLGSGTYSVTVTDLNGCSSTISTNITEPAALVSSITDSNDVSCNGGSDGFASVSVSGGIAPYTYLWDNGETNASAFSLNVGIHNVIITDANGCTTTSDVNITEPIILTSSITSINDVSCNGGSDGTVMANVSGGTAPYTYLWDNGQTTDSVYNLSAGDYNVTITDYNGCSSTITATINEPVTLNSSITGSNNVSCNGGSNGSAVVSASGGTAPYSYLWDNGQSNSYISSLSAGDYNVTVTDVNGCNTNSIVTILEPVLLSSSVISLSDVSCNGGSNGSAVISANGGITPYTYQWNNGQVGDSLSNLSAGNYNVVITDSNGCISANTITVSEPSLLVSSVSNISNVSCNGFSDGFATVSVSGGTAPYSYSWDNGQTSNTAIGLMAGNYNISITDLNGCSSTSTATIAEPIMLTSSITSTNDVSCNGGSDGSAVVSASGGTAPYTYLWTNGDTNLIVSIGLSLGS